MTKDILEIIKRKLRELEQTLIYLKETSHDVSIENIKEDMIRYWGIERGIQISIESIISVANIIISVSDKEKPSTYRETMMLLAELEVIPKKFAKKLCNMVGFRNILVHDYTKIDPEIIIKILKDDLIDFVLFINYMNAWIKDHD